MLAYWRLHHVEPQVEMDLVLEHEQRWALILSSVEMDLVLEHEQRWALILSSVEMDLVL